MRITDKVLRKPSIRRFHRGLIELGVDVDALYARLGINPDSMDSEEGSLSMSKYFSMLDLASRLSGIRFLAVELALAFDSDDLGVLAYLVRNARNFEHALDIIRRYITLVSPGSEVTLTDNEQDYVVAYRFSIASPAICYQDVEGTVAQFVLMIREGLDEPDWEPRQIYFAHSARNDSDYAGFPVGKSVVFDHPFSGVAFPKDVIQYPIESSDPKLLSILESQVLHSTSEILGQDSFLDRVRLLISSGLGNAAVSSDAIAAALGMSRRSMYRRLQDHGTAFNAVREDIIFKLARTSLTTSTAPIAHIAQELGYSDSTAFNRMFKRLSGTTPLQYRKIHSEE